MSTDPDVPDRIAPFRRIEQTHVLELLGPDRF
jgi:hypothetical protein